MERERRNGGTQIELPDEGSYTNRGVSDTVKDIATLVNINVAPN